MTRWHLSGTPFQVQVVAGEMARGKKGFAYFLEQGLGKTGIILNEITDLYMQDEIVGAIGITFKTLLTNWKDEAAKMSFPGNVYVWPDIKKIDRTKPFIIMVNFEVIINPKNFDIIEKILKDDKIYLFIDESSAMKNPSSKRTKAALRFSFMSEYERVASGTPITQNAGDVWASLKFIHAIRLRFFPFRNRFCTMGGYMGKQITGNQNETELSMIMSENGMMSKKADWTDLPIKIFMPPLELELAPQQKPHYASMSKAFIAMVSGQVVEAGLVLTQMIKLQQITSGYIKDENKVTIPLFDDESKIPKIQELHRIVEGTEGKILIFAISKYSLDVLAKQLAKYNPIVIRGGMSNDERKAAIDAFNNDPRVRVGIIQTQSGGHGLTLLGGPGPDRCHTTIYYENDFSLDRRLQSEDRNHRHGQDFPVTYWDFAGSEIEKTAVLALQAKKTMKEIVDDLTKIKPSKN